MLGATLRCRQAITFPFLSIPASIRSTETVVKIVLDVVFSRPLRFHWGTEFFGQEGGFNGVVALGFPAETPAQQRKVDSYVVLRNSNVFARSSRVPPGLWTGAQTSTLSPVT